MDQQVKVRGYRIELGEIEAAMKEAEWVEDAAAAAVGGERGEKRLVGYVVMREGRKIERGEMRRQLKERLPEYMVPTAYVELEELPLTANGKLDRKALPAPTADTEPADLSQVPSSPVEQALCRIWAEMLRLPQVGIHDNFFELGGDSILAIHVASRAQRAGISITPRQIFLHQSIAELATEVGTVKRLAAAQGLLSGPVPLTPIQARFFEQQRRHPHHYNQSLLLEGATPIDPLTLQAAVTALCLHHDQLRARFWREAGQWRQAISPQVPTDLIQMIDLSGLEASAWESAFRQAAGELQASLQLDEGRLLRLGYFDFGPEREAWVLVVAHHLVIDTVSWGVLLEDLIHAYEGLRRGEAVELAEKTNSYQQWAAGLEEVARAGELERQEGEYWRKVVRQGGGRLPRDYEEGENLGDSGATVVVGLSQEQTRQLVREVVKAVGGELQEVLVGALVESICAWSGGSGVKVELEGHGREEEVVGVDLTRSVGWLTSVYPVWIDRQAGEWPRQQMRRVEEQMRRVPQRGIGYGILRYLNAESEIARELSQAAEPEICFNYLGQFDEAKKSDRQFLISGAEHGPRHSPQDMREYTFEINCWISRGRFQSEWAYSRNLHRADTVERLAQSYLDVLRQIIASVSSITEAPSAVDLDVVGFDSQELDSILDGIEVEPEDAHS
ncbi:MAG TPA: condensation domain-containing protein [Blastocatellia bacterium]|nr:condensation domain-containing protein [Blastocatellia bacterium]